MLFSSTIKYYSKTVGERNEIDETLSIPLFVQTLLGQQVLNPKWSWTNKMFQHFFITTLMIYVLIGTIDILKDATDATLKAEGCYTIIFTCLFPVKYLLFINNRDTFRKVYAIAKTTLYDMIRIHPLVQSKDVLRNVKLVAELLLSSAVFPVLLYLVTALWKYALGARITMSKTTSILMPMTSPFYEIGLILHTMYMFEVAFTFLIIDMWFVFLMFFFCKASDGLEKVLEVESKGREETEEEYAKRLHESLRKFYEGHRQLMEYLNTLNDMNKWPTVIPLLNVLLAVSLILFLISEEIHWTFFSNMLPAFAECFAYNWFGEQVKTKAVLLNIALLNFDWTSMRKSDKKGYLIIVCYMNKEFCIKTAMGNDLSMLTMSAVFKASYQAFAVMKSMEN